MSKNCPTPKEKGKDSLTIKEVGREDRRKALSEFVTIAATRATSRLIAGSFIQRKGKVRQSSLWKKQQKVIPLGQLSSQLSNARRAMETLRFIVLSLSTLPGRVFPKRDCEVTIGVEDFLYEGGPKMVPPLGRPPPASRPCGGPIRGYAGGDYLYRRWRWRKAYFNIYFNISFFEHFLLWRDIYLFAV